MEYTNTAEVYKNEHHYFCNEKVFQDIKHSLKNNSLQNIETLFTHFCKIVNDYIVIDARFFKLIASPEHYEIIYNYITDKLNNLLSISSSINVYLNMNLFHLTDVEKYSDFFLTLAKNFQIAYPNKLNKCYVYGAGYILSGIHSLLSLVVDKQTRERFILVKE
jgi:hypothetical protein